MSDVNICDRCIQERLVSLHGNKRYYCVFCKEFMELQDAYAKLQDQQGLGPHTMSDEDFASLERVRAMCHGGAAAVALAIEGDGGLNLANVREMLQNGNKRLVKIIENFGGYNRVVALREQGKIDDAV
jgi:pentose-5-phosphate-3-epimerase